MMMHFLMILIYFVFYSARTLSKIETHLDTSNATEAWILLAIAAPNIKGHNPERVSKLLLSNLKYDMVSSDILNMDWDYWPIPQYIS